MNIISSFSRFFNSNSSRSASSVNQNSTTSVPSTGQPSTSNGITSSSMPFEEALFDKKSNFWRQWVVRIGLSFMRPRSNPGPSFTELSRNTAHVNYGDPAQQSIGVNPLKTFISQNKSRLNVTNAHTPSGDSQKLNDEKLKKLFAAYKHANLCDKKKFDFFSALHKNVGGFTGKPLYQRAILRVFPGTDFSGQGRKPEVENFIMSLPDEIRKLVEY